MSRVYEALDRSGERVALKVMHGDRSAGAQRRALFDEATAWARLRHPAVVEMRDVGERDDGALYLVLELVEGETLSRARLPRDRLLQALIEVLDGLAHAHAMGVVHGDV